MITRLRGANFLPFREDGFDMRLDNQGLVLIRGDNRVSNSANDNGAGKTTLPGHALSWGLWGEDLLGRKADAVACRFTDGQCYVRVDMVDAAGPWAVTRTRRPASLTVEGVTVPEGSDMSVVQAAIDSRLGFGLRTFRNAIVFGQGAFDRYASADQAEQMQMLDEIQGIDFTEARKRTKAWRDGLVDQRGEIENGINMDSAASTNVRNEIKVLGAIRDSYEQTKRQAIRGLMTRLHSDVEEVAHGEANREAIVRDVAVLEKLRVEDNKCTDLEGVLSVAKQEEQRAGAMQDEANRELRRFDEALEALFHDPECPTCRGKVDDMPRVRERFAKDRAALARIAASTLKTYRKALAISGAALTVLEAQQEIRAAFVPISMEPSKYIMRLEERCSPVAIKRLDAAVTQARALADTQKANIEKAERDTWDGAPALERAEQKDIALTTRIAREVSRLDKLDTALDLADYCTEAFSDRGLRSLLVDSVADFMNERMAYHLLALTAGEASNVMSAQTALKKGGARERISFTPTWAWGGEGAGTGSAGQDRRVDLATFAAVQDLAESRGARPFPLKVYDEPFDALDSRGKEMACAWLRAQAKEYGTVFLITHSEELAAVADPDKVWTIIHDQNGARFLS